MLSKYIPLFIVLLLFTYLPASSAKPDSISLVFDKNQLILPGEQFRIGAVSYFKNGKVKKTMGLCGGNMLWWRYKVEVSGGTHWGGRVTVNEELVPSKGKYIGLKVYPKRHPRLVKELLLPLNFETKIEYKPTSVFDKAPGNQIKGEVVVSFDNGRQRVYSDLKNSNESKYFQFGTRGGYWNNGKFIIDPEFTRISGHRSDLIVSSLRNKAVADTFSVMLDYKHDYKLHLKGRSGFWGACGSDGYMGASGADGGDGQPGSNGDFGEDGPEIGVWVDLYRDSLLNCDLLYVFAQDRRSGEEFRYLINPDGGSLDVSSIGGSGGDGGSGGNGGSGGQGVDGVKWVEMHTEIQIVKKPVVIKVTKKEMQKKIDASGNEYDVLVDVIVDETVYQDDEVMVVVPVEKQGPGSRGGDGGWGGSGGLGGQGGYGGDIALFFTHDAMPFKHLITACSEGGSGGLNGRGGSGGLGGSGGYGNPNGSSGSSGFSGPGMGWAISGSSGNITIQTTEEFFFYVPKQQTSDKMNLLTE